MRCSCPAEGGHRARRASRCCTGGDGGRGRERSAGLLPELNGGVGALHGRVDLTEEIGQVLRGDVVVLLLDLLELLIEGVERILSRGEARALNPCAEDDAAQEKPFHQTIISAIEMRVSIQTPRAVMIIFRDSRPGYSCAARGPAELILRRAQDDGIFFGRVA